MLNFRNRDEIAPSTIILLALLTLAGTLAYMLLVPPPSAAGITRGRERSRQQIEAEIDRAKEKGKAAQVGVAKRLWTGSPDAVQAHVLADLTTRAGRSKIQMAAFRPQRAKQLGPLTELPCSVQVTGPYNSVVAFLGTLDTGTSRVALRSAQISAADGNTSAVTATLGLSVYYAAEDAPLSKGENDRG